MDARVNSLPLIAQLQQFAPARVDTPQGAVQFRRACSPGYEGPVTHVLLHGIGSAAGSWLAQLLAVQHTPVPISHVLAWDAPGYGDSTPLPGDAPTAADYAARMWAWLDAVGVAARTPFMLVGHSLGALMAASAAAQQPERVRRLVLLAPAQGYAGADAALRAQKLAERLASLAMLGPAGMAAKRASAMLSPGASPEQIGFVEYVMAGIHPHGYTQAARMLSGGDVLADLRGLRCPVVVASGSADTVTPAHGCQALAERIGARYVPLGEVGHSCALEAGDRVNRLLGIVEGQA